MASYLVILAMLFNSMLPVAHASTAMSGKASGFMMTICSANNIGKANVSRETVYIPLAISQADEEKQTADNSTKKCAVCFLVDQHTVNNTDTLPLFKHLKITTHYRETGSSQQYVITPTHLAIRAPPL